MSEGRLRCIALRTVRYKDSRSVLTCFSREMGRVSFSVSDGRGREAMRRRALLMPGSVFECVADVSVARGLQRMGEVRGLRPVAADGGARVSVVFFICDVVNVVTREMERDEVLWDYVEGWLERVEEGRWLGNAPIGFMVGLLGIMGVLPDAGSYRRGRVLDLEGGVFRDDVPGRGRWLGVADSAVAWRLLRMTGENMGRFRFSREERRRVLDGIIDYCGIHFGGMSGLRSLDVVRSLFD